MDMKLFILIGTEQRRVYLSDSPVMLSLALDFLAS